MPNRVDEIRGWLAGVLGETELSLQPASSDASFRSYLRVGAGDRTYVVMDAPPDREDTRSFAAVAGLLGDAGLNVPRIYASDPERGLLLLSDLGCRRYLDVLDTDSADRLYGDAIGALLRMQAHAATTGLPRYDRRLLWQEMGLFRDWFLPVHLGIELTRAQHRVLAHSFDLLCRSATEQPQVFVHRDYHSRNLMLQPRNPGILDFQDAVLGPLTYDLVSLLRDVYVRWPRWRVEAWARRYRERALDRGILQQTDHESFLRWFDLMGVQRHLKVAGIFARLCHRDAKCGYLKDIPLALRYLLEACAAHAELAPLHRLLADLDLDRRLRSISVTAASARAATPR